MLISRYKVKIAGRTSASILILIISLFTFHKNVLAETKDQIAETYRVSGYKEQQKGNFDEALIYYIKALTLGYESAVIYNDMAVVYEQLGLFNKAEEFYLKAIKQDPKYLPPYMNIAYFYKQRGDIPKASQYFKERLRRAIQDDPWAEKAKRELLEISPEYQKELQDREAERLAEQARKVRDEFSLQISRATDHYQRGCLLVEDKKFSEAIDQFNRALAITPDNPKIIKGKQWALFKQTVEEIRQHSEKAVDLLEVGDVISAKEEFRKILTTIPKESIQISE